MALCMISVEELLIIKSRNISSILQELFKLSYRLKCKLARIMWTNSAFWFVDYAPRINWTGICPCVTWIIVTFDFFFMALDSNVEKCLFFGQRSQNCLLDDLKCSKNPDYPKKCVQFADKKSKVKVKKSSKIFRFLQDWFF